MLRFPPAIAFMIIAVIAFAQTTETPILTVYQGDEANPVVRFPRVPSIHRCLNFYLFAYEHVGPL